jgi:coenzyme F420-reducing hydrogenase beta subunit
MVSWVLEELLRRGLVDGVAHVAAVEDPQAEGKFFRYRIARTVEEIRAGAKSRYYPVELSGVLDLIRHNPGRYAVVGVPCFIKRCSCCVAKIEYSTKRIALLWPVLRPHEKRAHDGKLRLANGRWG